MRFLATVLFSLGAVAFLSTAKAATVSLRLEADLLKDQSGQALSLQSYVVLVASEDLANSPGFGTPSVGNAISVGNTLGGSDDVIVFAGKLSSISTVAGTFSTVITLTLDTADAGLTSGDRLQLYWFPTITTDGAVLTNGTPYGKYSNLSAVDGSHAYTVPTAPATNWLIGFYTKDGTRFSDSTVSNAPAAGLANLTVVPEPGTLMLALGSGAFLALRRRR